jgi:hypothetical protein
MTAELAKTMEMIDAQLADENTPEPMRQVLLKSKTSVIQDYIKGLNAMIKQARTLLPPKAKKETKPAAAKVASKKAK